MEVRYLKKVNEFKFNHYYIVDGLYQCRINGDVLHTNIKSLVHYFTMGNIEFEPISSDFEFWNTTTDIDLICEFSNNEELVLNLAEYIV